MNDLHFLIYPEDGDFSLDLAAFEYALRAWWRTAVLRPAQPPLPAWADAMFDVGELVPIYAPRPAGEQFFLRGQITPSGIVAWYAGADSFAEFAVWYRGFVTADYRLYAVNDLCTHRMELALDVTTRAILAIICDVYYK